MNKKAPSTCTQVITKYIHNKQINNIELLSDDNILKMKYIQEINSILKHRGSYIFKNKVQIKLILNILIKLGL